MKPRPIFLPLAGVVALTSFLAWAAGTADPAHGGAAHGAMSKALTIAKPGAADFKTVPGAAACNTMASLRGNLATGPSTFLARLTPGCIAPWHWHTPTEEIAILKGEAIAQMRGEASVRLPTGAYSQLPAKHQHRFRCTQQSECVILVIADGAFDIHWMDDAGKEISLEEAMKRAEAQSTAGW